MNRIKKWIFSGLILLVTGCVSPYSIFNLDVLKPAKVDVPVEIASVVVVDNAYPMQAGDSVVHKIKLPVQEYSIDTILLDNFGQVAIESFAESLKSKSFFDSVYVVNESFNTLEDGKPLAPLSVFLIDSLCNYYNAQAVIELGYYQYGTVLNVIDAGEQYYSALDVRVNTYWKIHNRLADSVMNVHLQKDTIFWEGAGATVEESIGELPFLKDALKEAALYSGIQYSGYIAPTWQTTRRVFFKQGHTLFYEALEYVNRDQWDEAARVWYHIYETGKEKQKARAAYNLALAQEVKGNFIEATAWAYRSMQHYKELAGLGVNKEEKMARDYYIDLAQRLQEKKKLDKQYGIYE
ncbi:MAG: DUF6340 family protein [Bacteroidota bacterium]